MGKSFCQNGKQFFIFLLQMIAVVLSGGALALYMITGKNEFSPDLSVSLMTAIEVFLLAQIAEIVLFILFNEGKVKPILNLLQFVVAIVGMLAFALFITNNVNYLASVMVAIDGTKITIEFIATVALLLGAFVLSLIAANVAVSVKSGGKRYEK